MGVDAPGGQGNHMPCLLAHDRESELTQPIARAFADPDKYDWSGVEGPLEATIIIALEYGESFFYAPNILRERQAMLDIVNGFGKDGPAIRFTHIRGGGLKLTRVD